MNEDDKFCYECKNFMYTPLGAGYCTFTDCEVQQYCKACFRFIKK